MFSPIRRGVWGLFRMEKQTGTIQEAIENAQEAIIGYLEANLL
jgi:predicted RNase H-like HicB family nuclease